MPTDDVQIHVVGAASIPLSYTIPGNGQLQPKAVSAVFDGTGASGNFLPVLEIISDGGILVARCPTGSSVAAGASAEVSWFPHVAETAGAAPTTAFQSWATIEAGALQTLTHGQTKPLPGAALAAQQYTNDPAVFSFGDVTLGGVVCPGIILNAIGHYRFDAVWFSFAAPPAAGVSYSMQAPNNVGVGTFAGPFFGATDNTATLATSGAAIEPWSHGSWFCTMDGSIATVPSAPNIFSAINADATRSFDAMAWVTCIYLDSDPTLL